MVKNELCAWTLRHQIDRDGKLACEHANIEGESVGRKSSDVVDEGPSLAEPVGLGVEDAPDPFQLGMPDNSVQVWKSSLSGRPQPTTASSGLSG
jgi:hypothetical protein